MANSIIIIIIINNDLLKAMEWDILFILREHKKEYDCLHVSSLLLHLYAISEFSVRFGHKKHTRKSGKAITRASAATGSRSTKRSARRSDEPTEGV